MYIQKYHSGTLHFVQPIYTNDYIFLSQGSQDGRGLRTAGDIPVPAACSSAAWDLAICSFSEVKMPNASVTQGEAVIRGGSKERVPHYE
jgi:hypothetical protein